MSFTQPRYVGSLIFEVLADVGERFTVSLAPMGESNLVASDSHSILPFDLENLTIEFIEPPPPPERIPTTSTWGIVVLSLSLLAGAKLWFGKHAFAT